MLDIEGYVLLLYTLDLPPPFRITARLPAAEDSDRSRVLRARRNVAARFALYLEPRYTVFRH